MLVARYVPPEVQPDAARPCWAMWRNARTRVLLLSATYFRKPSNVEEPYKIENVYQRIYFWKGSGNKLYVTTDFHRTRIFYDFLHRPQSPNRINKRSRPCHTVLTSNCQQICCQCVLVYIFKTESRLLTNIFLNYITTSIRLYNLTDLKCRHIFYYCGKMRGVERREQKKRMGTLEVCVHYGRLCLCLQTALISTKAHWAHFRR